MTREELINKLSRCFTRDNSLAGIQGSCQFDPVGALQLLDTFLKEGEISEQADLARQRDTAWEERDKAEGRLRAMEEESTRLRAALANSPGACVYCTLPKEDWGKCPHGFPGCSRAEDSLGCPHLDASLHAEELEAKLTIANQELLLSQRDFGRLCRQFSMQDLVISKLRCALTQLDAS